MYVTPQRSEDRATPCTRSPFDLDDEDAYRRWRETKIARHPTHVEELVVDVGDPRRLTSAERDAVVQRCRIANMAIYRSRVTAADKEVPRRLGQQLGLHRLDANWLADEDGISQVTVAASGGAGEAYIPYTNRAIKWHTDGYYHPLQRRIAAMILHCVVAAREGGLNGLMDHEMAYIALRDANPDWVRALMAPDAMTIPERVNDDGVARPAQAGPVFSVDRADGALHMRYTARTRSVEWRADAMTRAAVAFLEGFLASDARCRFSIHLEPGMGIVANNVLHDRSAFADDAQRARLLYRARYLDRVDAGSHASL
jgi:alpha-ketoglutarate-dependent taurine dioxygenase